MLKRSHNFAQFAAQMRPRFPASAELWTSYFLAATPYPKCALDWGPSQVYHFDRGVPIASWLAMTEQVRHWVMSQSSLEALVSFVPFYEIGADFLTQCKPPYDGGYPTTKYEEFLYHRSCEPAPWFFQQLAELHTRAAEALRAARRVRSSSKDQLLLRIVHATLITPHSHLFWLDQDGWAVFYPNIGAQDVRAWESLDTP